MPLSRLWSSSSQCCSLPVHIHSGSSATTARGPTISVLALVSEDSGGRLCCDSVIMIKRWVFMELCMLTADITAAN